MFSRKILSSVLSLAMAGVMVVPAFAGTAPANPVDSNDPNSSANASGVATGVGVVSGVDDEVGVTVKNPVIYVTLPTKLSFAIDPYEIEENGQINSPNFYAVNYSNVPVRIDSKFWVEGNDTADKKDLKIKELAEEVNGANAENYNSDNTDLEMFFCVAAANNEAFLFKDGANDYVAKGGTGTAGSTTVSAPKALANDGIVAGKSGGGQFAVVESSQWAGNFASLKEVAADSTKKSPYDIESDTDKTIITASTPDSGDTFSFYLEKGDPASKSNISGAVGALESISSKGVTAFRFLGNVNPVPSWSNDAAGTDAKVKVGTTFKLSALSPSSAAALEELRTGTSAWFPESSGPAVVKNADDATSTTVNLKAGAERSGVLELYMGKDVDGASSKAASNVTGVTIKQLPASATTTDKTKVDKVLEQSLWEFDAETKKLSLNIAEDSFYVERATVLAGTTYKTGFDVDITLDTGAVITGKVVFTNK